MFLRFFRASLAFLGYLKVLKGFLGKIGVPYGLLRFLMCHRGPLESIGFLGFLNFLKFL